MTRDREAAVDVFFGPSKRTKVPPTSYLCRGEEREILYSANCTVLVGDSPGRNSPPSMIFGLEDLTMHSLLSFLPFCLLSTLQPIVFLLVILVADGSDRTALFPIQRLLMDCTSESDLLGRPLSGRHRKLHLRRVGGFAFKEEIL